MSIRYIGGAIAFTAYYNVFYAKFYPLATLVGFDVAAAGICGDYPTLFKMINYAGRSQFALLHDIIDNNPNVMMKDIAFDFIIDRIQVAFAKAYVWPYYISIAFGGVCIVAACFLRDIRKHMVVD